MPNAEVVDLDKRVEKNIPCHLLYACKFWAMHLEDTEWLQSGRISDVPVCQWGAGTVLVGSAWRIKIY